MNIYNNIIIISLLLVPITNCFGQEWDSKYIVNNNIKVINEYIIKHNYLIDHKPAKSDTILWTVYTFDTEGRELEQFLYYGMTYPEESYINSYEDNLLTKTLELHYNGKGMDTMNYQLYSYLPKGKNELNEIHTYSQDGKLMSEEKYRYDLRMRIKTIDKYNESNIHIGQDKYVYNHNETQIKSWGTHGELIASRITKTLLNGLLIYTQLCVFSPNERCIEYVSEQKADLNIFQVETRHTTDDMSVYLCTLSSGKLLTMKREIRNTNSDEEIYYYTYQYQR